MMGRPRKRHLLVPDLEPKAHPWPSIRAIRPLRINYLTLLLLSLLDLGYLSFWTIPPVAVTTLLSHFIFPFLAYAPRPESSPSYFSTVIVCVYTLPIAWFIASVSAFTVVAMENRWEWKLDAVKAAGGAATQGAQNVQVLFSWVEVGLLLMFEVKAHRRLNIEGEPESWRPPIPEIPEQDKSMVGPSTVMFDAREPNGREDKQVNLSSSGK